MNGSDKVVLLRWCCDECVLVEELDVIDREFELSGVAAGKGCKEVELCESS